MVEDLLGNLQRLNRIPSQCQFSFGDRWRRAGAAQNLFEKAFALARFPLLGLSERFSAVEISRFPDEDLIEQVDGVVEVIPLQGLVAFGKQNAHIARQFVHTFLCHAGNLGTFARNCRGASRIKLFQPFLISIQLSSF